MEVPQVQNHLSARSLLWHRLTQASLLPSFVGRLRSFEMGQRFDRGCSTCENRQTRAIQERSGFGDLVFRRSHAAVSRSSSTRRCFPCPQAFLPTTTPIRSPSTDEPAIDPTTPMSVVRNDRLWHRLSGVSVLGRAAGDGLRTMPPPSPAPVVVSLFS